MPIYYFRFVNSFADFSEKRGGGGENSPISPHLDPRLLELLLF